MHDVVALWCEILGFVQDSVDACERGRRPWILASVSLGLCAAGGAVCAVTLAARPVVSGLSGSFWITRVVSLRLLALVYTFAFAAALFQNKALIGDRGILPAKQLLDRADAAVEAALCKEGPRGQPPWQRRARRLLARVEVLPTLLWLAGDRRRLDRWLDGLALCGLVLSLLALVVGGASAWHLLGLWLIYHSINAVGQRWYSFGWESQLLETTLLAVLAAPAGLLGCSAPGAAFPSRAAPPAVAICAFRWMAFRIMLGAGLIKIRGAKCWLDLTAMCYHLETQPIPNPLSRRFHNMPRQALLMATACNHVIELLAPWLLLLPWRPAAASFGVLHVVFQASLILTGNLSFLNWLTIIPGLWCFDDAVWAGLLPGGAAASLARFVSTARMADLSKEDSGWPVLLSLVRDAAAVATLLWLSVPVYKNLLGARGGGRQRMNSAFERTVKVPLWCLRPLGFLAPRGEEMSVQAGCQPDKGLQGAASSYVSIDLRSLRLLNTYGAFGSVNKERVEIVFEGSLDSGPKAGLWRPYTFKAAVDDPMKRPTWLAPYHLRLDWCRWIASCRGRRSQGLEERWALAFAGRLLMGDEGVRRLLGKGGDPFAGGPPPSRVRAGLYVYGFAPPPGSADDPYWLREYVGQYLPPLRLKDLAPKLREWGMLGDGLSVGRER